MLDDRDDDIHPLFHGAPTGPAFRKLRKRLVQQVREAIDTYGMVRAGDRWLICLSGGKDSYALLAILHELKWRGQLPVDLLACNLDQGQPGFPATLAICSSPVRSHLLPRRTARPSRKRWPIRSSLVTFSAVSRDCSGCRSRGLWMNGRRETPVEGK